MNLESEKYEGELRYLRNRVKELEMDLSYLQKENYFNQDNLSYDEMTVQQDKFF